MSEAPERIYMDPDIRFPECEKQYGCDVEYVRADMLHEIFLRYSKAETLRIEDLEAKLSESEALLAKAVKLMEVSVEVAGWELDLDLRDEVIEFFTELKGEK